MRKNVMVSLVGVVALCLAGFALAEGEATEPKAQTKCPVLGGEIDKSVYVDHGGKRIYFCCEMCIDKFKKDPEKYMKKLEEWGVTPEDAAAATEGPAHEHESDHGDHS
jgi:YHS domain-containing protein